MNFSELQLIEPILRALRAEGYETPTPIQQQAIPIVLQGRDLLGCAQTGTGKTAAFSLPILQLLHAQKVKQDWPRGVKTLILTPTRELAIQIDESLETYGKFLGLRHLVIFGGVGQQPQVDALRRGVDILVATPGRMLDLINQRLLSLNDIRFFVLDEADRMLDMGFIHDVKKVIALLPKKRQTLFFSATMPPEIVSLAGSMLTDPLEVSVTPNTTTAEKVEQHVFFVDKNDKRALLAYILEDKTIARALVFTRTKHGADRVARDLKREGITADAIHGNKAQNARQKALNGFKDHKIRVLVATDIAARGIDVDDLTHVINFEIPNIAETYVHRIGRTGRAGASGIALSFCDEIEGEYLRDIQKLIGQKVPVVEDHPFAMPMPEILSRPTQPTRNQAVAKKQPQQKPQNQRHQHPPRPSVQPPSQPRNQGENRSENRPQPNQKPAPQNFSQPKNQGENRSENRPQPNQKGALNFSQIKNQGENLSENRPQPQQKPAAQNLGENRSEHRQPKSQKLTINSPKSGGNSSVGKPKHFGNQKFVDISHPIPKLKSVPPVARPMLENDESEAEKRKKRLESFGGLFKNKI